MDEEIQEEIRGMARARNIKPGFFKNEDLASLHANARLLFIGLWTLADREGRLEDRPKRIRAEIFPYDDVDVDKLLESLLESGFIDRYEVNGQRIVSVVNFGKHQKPHHMELPSDLPPPPEGCNKYNHLPIGKEQRTRILERDRFTCVLCNSMEQIVIDHIIPVAKGGSSEDVNLRVLCFLCNARKGDRLDGEYTQRPEAIKKSITSRSRVDHESIMSRDHTVDDATNMPDVVLIPSSLIPDSLNLIPDSPNDPLSQNQELQNQNHSSTGLDTQEQNSAPAAAPAAAVLTPDETYTKIDLVNTGKTINQRCKDAGITLGATGKREVAGILQRLDPDVDEGALLLGVDAIIAGRAWTEYRFPSRTFIACLVERLEDLPRPRAATAPAQRSVPVAPSASREEAPARPTGSQSALPDFVLRWNAAVPPVYRVTTWNGRSPSKELAQADSEPEFVDNFDLILERCNRMIAAARYDGIGFTWLFKTVSGQQINWWRVIHGEFVWTEKTAAAASKLKSPAELAKERYEKVLREEELKNGKNGSKHGESRNADIGGVGVPDRAANDGERAPRLVPELTGNGK